LLTPAHDTDPALFEQRRRRLRVALAWTARILDLPAPNPPEDTSPNAAPGGKR
jgi:hypothetical protein